MQNYAVNDIYDWTYFSCTFFVLITKNIKFSIVLSFVLEKYKYVPLKTGISVVSFHSVLLILYFNFNL